MSVTAPEPLPPAGLRDQGSGGELNFRDNRSGETANNSDWVDLKGLELYDAIQKHMGGRDSVADSDALKKFQSELQRLWAEAEPTLYPAYLDLLRSCFAGEYAIDTNRRTAAAGFPDLTISNGLLVRNWIEVKSPKVSIDPLPPVDQIRFDRYKANLPHVTITNGWHWQVFVAGDLVKELKLPIDWLRGVAILSTEQVAALDSLLNFIETQAPTVATSDEEAVELLAAAARLVHDAVVDIDPTDYPVPLAAARDAFTKLLRTNPADASELAAVDFADALAQTVTFGFLLGRIDHGKAVDPQGATAALSSVEHPFLKAALYGLQAPDPELESIMKGVMRTACDMVNRAAPMLAADDWKKVTYIYEDFFAKYRPEDRFRYGVFYTPPEITRFQVRRISEALKREFGLKGLSDPAVRYLDPACGTGTYLLALLEGFEDEVKADGGAVGAELRQLVSQRLVGFEVSPGPATVAQARLSSWLRSRKIELGARFPVYTVNSLTPPVTGGSTHTGNLWSDNVSDEQSAGDKVKAETKILVVFGNPPWGRRNKDEFSLADGRNLIVDWAKNSKGAVQSLYDLYVAFLKFSVELLLHRPDVQEPKGIISYITNRSWLRGKAFSQLRKELRAYNPSSETYDLGGDVRAGAKRDDEGVFAIEAGSAITTMCVGGIGSGIKYARIRGDRKTKLAAIAADSVPSLGTVTGDNWFAPVDWGSLADAQSIDRFFARHHPGLKSHRDHLIIDVSRGGLEAKLLAWSKMSGVARTESFKPSRSRMPPAPSYKLDFSMIRPIRYRPLDNRFLYSDRLFIQEPGQILTLYETAPTTRCLLTMDSRTSDGPVIVGTNNLPAYNSFRGSYETHAFPVELPDVDLGGPVDPLSAEARKWANGFSADAEEVAYYLLALGNAPSYARAFIEAMETERVRFPATSDEALFREAAKVGKRLMQAWCLSLSPIGVWQEKAPGMPLGKARLVGDRIEFANGNRLNQIHPDSAALAVSGYPILQRYLEDREHLILDTALAQYCRLLAASIAAILDARHQCDDLLKRIISMPTSTF